MKILVNAITNHTAGSRSVGLNFLRSLAQGHFEHELVAYAPRGVGYESISGGGLRIEFAPPIVHRGHARFWVDHVWMRRVLERERPDLMYAMGSIAYPNRIPQVVLYHWPYAIYPEREVWSRMTPRDRLDRGFRRWLFGRRARYASCFAAQTETARARLERIWGLTNAAVVPNAVSLPNGSGPGGSGSTRGGAALARARQAVPPGARALLCLTRYYPHKNLEILVDVGRRIRDRALPLVVLTTVSPDDDRSAARFLDDVRREGLEGVLVNLGTVPMENVPALYDFSSGLLLPTLMESFSGTYVESMFYGRPVFTSDRDFARDVCGDVAYYFDPHDPDSILATLQGAFDDPDGLARRVEAGRARCAGFPHWPEVTRQYVELFERVYRESRAGAGTA